VDATTFQTRAMERLGDDAPGRPDPVGERLMARTLVLQPLTLAEVDAERLEQLRQVQARTMAATDAARSGSASPPPPPPPVVVAPAPPAAPAHRRARPAGDGTMSCAEAGRRGAQARKATSGRRASRARQVAPPTARPAPPAPPKPAPAPSLPLRPYDPADKEPNYGGSYRSGLTAWLEEKALRRAGKW
jgi:hypothetical protein